VGDRAATAAKATTMRLTIVAVGRTKPGPLRDLYELFAGRLAQGGPLGPLSLKEVEERRPVKGAELKAREAALLRAALPQSARVIALDERGKALDSAAFAGLLGCWRDEGLRETAFVIGGADGLDPDLRASADLLLSLGPMTWPHLLARALLAEQLYRAQTILAGHPYHRR
jgi:23S rRNA (pseudouridine1915-N3)-methyltransferase